MVDLTNSRILVTGGCGFIGSNFIEMIDEMYKIEQIVNLDKMGIGSRSLEHIDFRTMYYECDEDISDYKNVKWLGGMEIDYVFHFAAESHVDRSITGPSDFIRNNVMATTNLLEYIRNHQPQARLINISTDEVYGHLGLDDEPFTEDSPICPRSPYSASKAASDLIVNSYVETYGIDAVTTRCCNNFGPYQADEKFIPTVIRHLVSGEPIPVYGTGQNIREWIHVDDHNKSILEIAKIGESGKVYNIGSGNEKTNLDMIRWISSTLKIDPIIKFVEDRKGHDFRYAIKSNNYNRVVQCNTLDGFINTVNFYKNLYEKR